MSGFVYFIERQSADMVKIGWSKTHPSKRLATLQTGCPEPLRLAAFFPGSLQDEARLHRTFEPLNYRGEWFFNKHKLEDFVLYLNEHEESGPFVERQRFEDAVWDVLVGDGYDYPFREDVESYRVSADGSEWGYLFEEEEGQ